MSMISPLPLLERSDFRHLQAPFNKSKPRTTLTVETTIVFLICDKFCQNLYKSVPIFMSFTSFQVYFTYFHFDLTFLHYMSFWGASRRILCVLPSSWTNMKNIIYPSPPLIGEGNHVMVGEVFSIKLVILSDSEES